MLNTNAKFKYISQIMNVDDIKNDDTLHFLPNVYESIVLSKQFNNYETCLKTCNLFLKDRIDEMNQFSDDKYIIVWNENPKYTKSKNKQNATEEIDPWQDDEIVKLYIAKASDVKNQKMIASVKTTIVLVIDKDNEANSVLLH